MKFMKTALILSILLACHLDLSAAIPASERQALFNFYDSTNGGNWYNRTGWLGGAGTEDSWYGVSVTSFDGGKTHHVIGLFLSENNLVGSLPSSLEDLPYLYALHLHHNQLEGDIPPEIGSLSSLHALWLTSNQLTGSIPPELGALGNLQHLILDSNQLTGYIPSELGNLKILNVLYLNNNQLTGDIPPELGKLSNLQDFMLNSNQLTGDIPSDLGKLINLQKLFLNDNQLTGDIPTELDDLNNLQILFLDNNELTGSIPTEFGGLFNLTHLLLYSNHLEGGIPSSLGSLGKLQHLLLNSNQLEGAIPVSLKNLNPTGININYNALYSSDTGLTAYLDSRSPGWASTQTIAPTNVTAVPGDASVTVSWNPIPYNWDTGGYRVYIAEEILSFIGPYTLYTQTANKAASSQLVSGLTNGHTYHFKVQTRTDAHAYNQNVLDSEFSNTAWATPTMVWITALTLTSLNGGENLAAGSSQNVTWTTTGSMANVKLEYSTNNGTNWTTIIASTANTNSYAWTIPNTPSAACLFRVSDASNSSVYDISNGTFTILPSSPAAQRQALLDLYNSTNGAGWTNKTNWLGAPGTENTWYGVSTDAGSMTVVGLLLGNNNLVGTIPASLGNLSNLNTLQLNSNKLTGSIPPSLGHLINLQQLSLFSNQLTGSIPAELSNLSSLTSIYVFSNQLTGSIPSGLGALAGLQYLDLHDNQITGEIPSDLGNLSNLLSLYLCNNQLSGSIPSSLGTLSKLQNLFLHANQLTGSIPSSLTNLTGLSSGSTWIAYNALHTSDAALIAFLNSKEQYWASTQTIAPTSVSAIPGAGSATISWTPIPYTSETGGYRIFYGTVAGGPYTLFAQTANKSATSQVVSGLTPGLPYYFVVKTRTDAHAGNLNVVESEDSDEVTATPLIVTGGALTVTSPNGGENWLLGSTHTITWTSTGAIANVKIEYSTDNGANWTTIIASKVNNGVCSWTSGSPTNPALNTLSTTCRVRVSDAAGVAAPDMSDTVFTISATGVIAGTVTDLAGTPIPDVYVQIYDPNNVRVSRGWTNASGQYWIGGLVAGSYKVVYFNDATRNFLYEWYNDLMTFNAATPVAVTLNNTTGNINAQLGAGGIIGGRVTDENGAGLPNVTITVWTENGLLGNWTATSDSSGNYQVKGLPAGNCKLMFGLSGYPSKYYGNFYSFEPSTAVSVSLGVETSGINMVLEKGGWISGTVTDGSGNPVSGIQIMPYDAADNSYLRTIGELTAADGIYSVLVRPGQTKVYFDASVKPSSGLRSQFYGNQTSFAAAGTVNIVKDQTTPNINAVLAAGGGTLTVNVTNGLGQGVPAVVYLYNPLLETRMTMAVWTEANGDVQIKGLLPGNYKVKAYDSNGDLGRYNTEWYDNALTFGAASTVNITEGGNTPVSIVLDDAISAPEINLKQGATNIVTGGTYGFGSKNIGTVTDADFTIENHGTAALTLTGLPLTIAGTNADQFAIAAQPTSPVTAAGSKTFSVRFRPTTVGAKTAQISIANNDGNENPYVLNLTGTGNISAGVPTIGLSKMSFNFGAERNGTPTPAETSVISNTGTGTMIWTAIPSADWISVSPGSGIGSGVLTVGISRTDMSPGYYTGTIAISVANATNSPQTINVGLDVLPVNTDSPPFGNYATPTDGATVSSSIPVTGWVLDDVGVRSVKIYRGTGLSDRVYIGDAVFSKGARPDVEAAYPGYPQNDRAGWGYMLLTNFLPNGGNGPFTILAYATDSAGQEVLLGSKTITGDNSHTVKPFGAIDTPSQGGIASGSAFINFGWALTPQPNSIPIDGSTLTVFVDGLPLGHPFYNFYRVDVATLFPGYANSNGAVGYYSLDTTGYANAVHTIAWLVIDSAGNADGIGSRYFTVQNVDGGSGVTGSDNVNSGGTGTEDSLRASSARINRAIKPALEIEGIPEDRRTPVYVTRGYRDERPTETVFPGTDGSSRIEIPAVSRVAVSLIAPETRVIDEEKDAHGRRSRSGSTDSFGASRFEAYQLVLGELRPLPIGATFDAECGVMYWQPGPGFLGEYQFVLFDLETMMRKSVKIMISAERDSIR